MKKVFAIYDSKAACHLDFWLAPTKAAAVRNFEAAAMDEESNFHRWAADYTLFYLGEWDEETATFYLMEAKESMGTALEHLQSAMKDSEMKRLWAKNAQAEIVEADERKKKAMERWEDNQKITKKITSIQGGE